jgi:hypothetical protein
MRNNEEFQNTFRRLKAILEPYAPKLVVSADNKTYYSLETSYVMKNKHRLYFAGVRMSKAYVSFHLMPVYAFPELLARMSPELKKRMQGKSCSNFTTVDERLFKELAKLTKAGLARFKDEKFLRAISASRSA